MFAKNLKYFHKNASKLFLKYSPELPTKIASAYKGRENCVKLSQSHQSILIFLDDFGRKR